MSSPFNTNPAPTATDDAIAAALAGSAAARASLRSASASPATAAVIVAAEEDRLARRPTAARSRAAALHDFLLEHAFYPLALCAGLCLAFWAVRIGFTRTLTYDFLIKNLFLAWLPYFFALAMVHVLNGARSGKLWKTVLLGFAWLTTLPNAPYIFTDLIHWRNRPRVMPWWFDLGLVLMFALAGCFAGIVSLKIVHDLVRRAAGTFVGWAFVGVVALLSGFGIYLGRFERWNSWDLLTQPHRILWRTLYKSLNPYLLDRTLGVTLMFGAMILVTYVMFVSMQPKRPIGRDA